MSKPTMRKTMMTVEMARLESCSLSHERRTTVALATSTCIER